ncbi:MAG: hypothetical protein IKX29_00940 [Bacteroidales bacterium]|nr:hypothetical protein [Bacteroidales bacterium]
MRNTYHICLASHEEVLHRSVEDYIYDVNCFAVAVHRTESRALADSFMSTHDHFCVQTDDVKDISYIRRNAYTRYFNSKYGRKGRLGDTECFITELEGIRRIVAAVSYVNRNPLHHGLTSTPFEYEYCSANAVFRKALGKTDKEPAINQMIRHRFLPRNCSLPDSFRIDESGMIRQEDIIDVRYVEELFVTPRSYLYMMNRYSDGKWIKEQLAEDSLRPAVTLEMIEQDVNDDPVEKMLSYEHGRVNFSSITDLELCRMIDNDYVPRYQKDSVYHLTDVEKSDIGNKLWSQYRRRVSEKQIKRCLIL